MNHSRCSQWGCPMALYWCHDTGVFLADDTIVQSFFRLIAASGCKARKAMDRGRLDQRTADGIGPGSTIESGIVQGEKYQYFSISLVPFPGR